MVLLRGMYREIYGECTEMEKHADSAGVHFYAQENFLIRRPIAMLEKEIERKLKKRVEELGCLCLKFESPGFTGVPDRIILMPGGEMFFVETKAPGQKERPRQEYVQDRLRRLGFIVISSVDSEEDINRVCGLCESWMQQSSI